MHSFRLSTKTTFASKPNLLQRRNFEVLSTTITTGAIIKGALGLSGLSAVGFGFARYKIAEPHQYLVRTGIGIQNMDISKHGMHWPLQKYRFISLNPEEYHFNLNALTKEKIDFKLPTVFTIGPENEHDSLVRYCSTLDGIDKEGIEKIILGVLEGEARLQCSQMTIEEIFDNRDVFRKNIIDTIQKELHCLGLKIHNANFKELDDGPGSNYFATLKQKKLSQITNETKITVAEENKKGNIGEKENEAITRQRVAYYNAETIKLENERSSEIAQSNAELEIIRADARKRQEIARIESDKAALKKEAELQKEVEEKKILMEIEKIRAVELSRAQVEAEAIIKKTEGQAKSTEIKANADLYAKQREADGIKAIYEAQSEGISRLIHSFNNDSDAVIRYLMSQGVTFTDLANANAEAIKGLKPKINVWTTDGNPDGYTQPISNLLKTIPQTLDAIHHQTGMKPADWLK